MRLYGARGRSGRGCYRGSGIANEPCWPRTFVRPQTGLANQSACRHPRRALSGRERNLLVFFGATSTPKYRERSREQRKAGKGAGRIDLGRSVDIRRRRWRSPRGRRRRRWSPRGRSRRPCVRGAGQSDSQDECRGDLEHSAPSFCSNPKSLRFGCKDILIPRSPIAYWLLRLKLNKSGLILCSGSQFPYHHSSRWFPNRAAAAMQALVVAWAHTASPMRPLRITSTP